MTRLVIVTSLLAITAVAACRDSNAPDVAHIDAISAISVPAHASTGDTVKITFDYAPFGCDTGDVVEARTTTDGLRFTARNFSTNEPCPAVLHVQGYVYRPPHVEYIVAPPHLSPMKFVFTQPDGADSVRVVGP
jgi:hypothetical protein